MLPGLAGRAGNVSLKATLPRALPALGLVILNVSVAIPPSRIGSGAKALAMLGGARAVRVAVAILFLLTPLSVVARKPLVLL